MKTSVEIKVNAMTDATESSPAGRCRLAVRGFSASMKRSAKRLNAIAAERAPTMQTKIPTKSMMRKLTAKLSGAGAAHAIAAANNANGNANTVWLKRIISSILRMVLNIGWCEVSKVKWCGDGGVF